jgi:hypothetical protein
VSGGYLVPAVISAVITEATYHLLFLSIVIRVK